MTDRLKILGLRLSVDFLGRSEVYLEENAVTRHLPFLCDPLPVLCG
jgi:hypothetical protein